MSITFIWIHCLNISNYKTGCNILFELIAVFYSYEQSYNNTRKIFCLFFFPFFGGGECFYVILLINRSYTEFLKETVYFDTIKYTEHVIMCFFLIYYLKLVWRVFWPSLTPAGTSWYHPLLQRMLYWTLVVHISVLHQTHSIESKTRTLRYSP